MKPWKALALCVLTLAGCDTTGPGTMVDETELNFVRFPPDLLPLVTTHASFWAVAGENRELVMRYQAEEPGETGDEFLRFRVDARSLLRRPDGTRFQDGDSVRITVDVSPDGRFLFEFEPSGLRFSPERPAHLRIRYERADDDLDNDGDIDRDDEELERRLRIWRRESPGAPWSPVGSIRYQELEEIEAWITGFTGFAIAG